MKKGRAFILLFIISIIVSCNSRKYSEEVKEKQEVIKIKSHRFDHNYYNQIEIDISNKSFIVNQSYNCQIYTDAILIDNFYNKYIELVKKLDENNK